MRSKYGIRVWVHLLGGDLAVAEVEDVGVEPRPNPWAGQILNATEAPLEQNGERNQVKSDQRS
ncbi:hypothetical protein CLG94_09090 [Candidatus Methylomirabilis limnetica]|uniref:Uncharacterized protein n=1 Tax=Candidatus Methylomirabilis limnetica TaxID=2033718 RepID=A0A2T4TXQ2_9BACT|nr:hypothetical protein [Candidatus Methylomirabilis limnetica]PTL35895.1 hypothetical protein CLG94_09090 [Candidatus Methylomirabilis limnetica]